MGGLLVIFSGPSGVGKTTITRAVIERVENATMSVSATTRPIREKERDGVDYFFVDKDTFAEMESSGEMLETARVFDKGPHLFGIGLGLGHEGRDVEDRVVPSQCHCPHQPSPLAV